MILSILFIFFLTHTAEALAPQSQAAILPLPGPRTSEGLQTTQNISLKKAIMFLSQQSFEKIPKTPTNLQTALANITNNSQGDPRSKYYNQWLSKLRDQFDRRYIPRELISNALDKSSPNQSVRVEIEQGRLYVHDEGEGMTFPELLYYLLTPSRSSNPLLLNPQKADKQRVGRFGQGFFSIFSLLQAQGDTITLESEKNNKRHRMQFHLTNQSITVSISEVKPLDQKGTRIWISSSAIDEPLCAAMRENGVAQAFRYYGCANKKIILNGSCVNPNTFYSEQKGPLTLSYGTPTNDQTGRLSVSVAGVAIVSYPLKAPHIMSELNIDFPSDTDLLEERASIDVHNENNRRHVKNIIKWALEKPLEIRYTLLNTLHPLLLSFNMLNKVQENLPSTLSQEAFPYFNGHERILNPSWPWIHPDYTAHVPTQRALHHQGSFSLFLADMDKPYVYIDNNNYRTLFVNRSWWPSGDLGRLPKEDQDLLHYHLALLTEAVKAENLNRSISDLQEDLNYFFNQKVAGSQPRTADSHTKTKRFPISDISMGSLIIQGLENDPLFSNLCLQIQEAVGLSDDAVANIVYHAYCASLSDVHSDTISKDDILLNDLTTKWSWLLEWTQGKTWDAHPDRPLKNIPLEQNLAQFLKVTKGESRESFQKALEDYYVKITTHIDVAKMETSGMDMFFEALSFSQAENLNQWIDLTQDLNQDERLYMGLFWTYFHEYCQDMNTLLTEEQLRAYMKDFSQFTKTIFVPFKKKNTLDRRGQLGQFRDLIRTPAILAVFADLYKSSAITDPTSFSKISLNRQLLHMILLITSILSYEALFYQSDVTLENSLREGWKELQNPSFSNSYSHPDAQNLLQSILTNKVISPPHTASFFERFIKPAMDTFTREQPKSSFPGLFKLMFQSIDIRYEDSSVPKTQEIHFRALADERSLILRVGQKDLLENNIRRAMNQSFDPYAWISELIKNSKEAGAKNITIAIQKDPSGKLVVEFKDNGAGMDQDAALAMRLPHYTTKKATGNDRNYGWGFFTVFGFFDDIYVNTKKDKNKAITFALRKTDHKNLSINTQLEWNQFPSPEIGPTGTVMILRASEKPATEWELRKLVIKLQDAASHIPGVTLTINGKPQNEASGEGLLFTDFSSLEKGSSVKIFYRNREQSLVSREGVRMKEVAADDTLFSNIPPTIRGLLQGKEGHLQFDVDKNVAQNTNRSDFLNKNTWHHLQKSVLKAVILLLHRSYQEGLPSLITDKHAPITQDFFSDYATNYQQKYDLPSILPHEQDLKLIQKALDYWSASDAPTTQDLSAEEWHKILSHPHLLGSLLIHLRLPSTQKPSLYDTQQTFAKLPLGQLQHHISASKLEDYFKIQGLIMRQQISGQQKRLITLGQKEVHLKAYEKEKDAFAAFLSDLARLFLHTDVKVDYYLANDNSLARAAQQSLERKAGDPVTITFNLMYPWLENWREMQQKGNVGSAIVANMIYAMTHELTHADEGYLEHTHDIDFFRKQLEKLNCFFITLDQYRAAEGLALASKKLLEIHSGSKRMFLLVDQTSLDNLSKTLDSLSPSLSCGDRTFSPKGSSDLSKFILDNWDKPLAPFTASSPNDPGLLLKAA